MIQVFGLQFDTIGTLPFSPKLQAFYLNGAFARRPVSFGRGRVWIDVLGDAPGECFWLDVEKGDATPGAVPGWLDERRAAGEGNGGIYCNRATLPAVVAAAAGRPFSLWLATLDGSIYAPGDLDVPPNVSLELVQAYPAGMFGINADISAVVHAGYWASRHA